MIRRSTLVYIVLLLGLVGAYYYLNNRAKTAEAEATATAIPSEEITYLFPAEEGTPSSIRVEAKSGKIVEMARDAENTWELTQPDEAAADSASAEAAASQATTMRILDSVPDVDPKIVGLETPEYVLTITFTSGAEHTVDIGVVTPTENGYYVRDTAGKIVIVSRDAIDSLLGLLDHPPYLETPTPPPTTPEADALPSATATP